MRSRGGYVQRLLYISPLPQKRVALNSRACSLVPVTGVVSPRYKSYFPTNTATQQKKGTDQPIHSLNFYLLFSSRDCVPALVGIACGIKFKIRIKSDHLKARFRKGFFNLRLGIAPLGLQLIATRICTVLVFFKNGKRKITKAAFLIVGILPNAEITLSAIVLLVNVGV